MQESSGLLLKRPVIAGKGCVNHMDLEERVRSVIRSVKPIEIESLDDSVFSSKYGLEPNDLVYILLLASEQMGFLITEEFIDSLEEHNSFREVIDYIGSHIK